MDLHFETATRLLAALRSRELRSSDLLEQLIGRIEKLDGGINAVITRDFDRARERARAADAALDAGDARPLLGLPLTVKDAFETEGVVTSCGAPELAEHRPERHADVVQKLVDAGAIPFAKTNVPLYAGDCQTFNELHGVTKNPWDPSRTPGGSSGGAAAALAMGFSPVEIGSDIGGSIRNPSHFCGTFGHKPTWGIVPDRGHIPGPPGQLAARDLNVVGPMARCAEDLALLLDLSVGPNSGLGPQGWKLELPPRRERRPRELRVAAWLDDPFSPVDADYLALLEACAEALEREGAHVDRRARPEIDFAGSYRTYTRLLIPVIAAGYPPAVMKVFEAEAQQLAPDDQSQRALHLRGALTSHRDWITQNEIRHHLIAAWSRFFEDFDLLLMPVSPTAAFPHDHDPDFHARHLVVNGVERSYLDFLHWVSLPTVAGLPSSVAPIGLTPAGLPVGVQLVGRRFGDHLTIEGARLVGELLGGFVPPPASQI